MHLSQFNQILSRVSKDQWSEECVREFVGFISEEKDINNKVENKNETKERVVKFDKLNRIIDLFQYSPALKRKDKNLSEQIYFILTSNKQNGANQLNELNGKGHK